MVSTIIRETEPVYASFDIDVSTLAPDAFSQEEKDKANMALYVLTGAIALERAVRPAPLLTSFSSGRTIASINRLGDENPAFADALATVNAKMGSNGAQIETRVNNGPLIEVPDWPGGLSGWDREQAAGVLGTLSVLLGGLELQEDEAQNGNKLSYYTSGLERLSERDFAELIRKLLAEYEIPATVTFSGDRFLDILPRTADGRPIDKATSLEHSTRILAEQNNLAGLPRLTFTCDSGNDRAAAEYVISQGGFVIVPSNAGERFKQAIRNAYPRDQAHISEEQNYGDASREGLERFGILTQSQRRRIA